MAVSFATTYTNNAVRKAAPVMTGQTSVASTSSYAAILGMDLLGTQQMRPWFQVSETGGTNGVTAKVQMSVDGQAWFDVSSTSIASNGTATSAVAQSIAAGTSLLIYVPTCARLAQLVIEDASGGSHGAVSAEGFGQ